MKSSHIALLLSLAVATPLFGAAPVTLTEQMVNIPTYLIGPPDPNPQFYFGAGTQGAQQRIYPYPSYDILTTEKAEKAYKMVYLENEYIKVGVIPDSGGKIFEAIDKTNGYNFFYRQHVIKPALISILGAWISGGVEWDIPHHHRATSFVPVQYTTEESPDGSKTVWVGELELRDRMRWAGGVTLHPGKSYLEAKFRLMNRTPLPTSMLCFSNVAVHVNNDYQVIFPPSTQWGTGHSKRDFSQWPIDNGTDISWYKNLPGGRSVFAWNFQDDFMAGYDHGKQTGTMSVADHNVVSGKKFFTWGTGPGGRNEELYLTDNDGPYIELMVGAYSDNQPDYSWITPFETRSWSQFWYPFRDIDGVKCANIDAAVNLTVENGRVKVGFFSTSDRPTATASLKLKGQTIFEETVAINPGKPFMKDVPLPAGADEHDLRAALSAGGHELVAYSPIKLVPEPRPAVVTNFPAPAQFKTNEELYLAGLRVDQFHAPAATGEPFWQEALNRDPGDLRVNTVMGIEAIRGGRFAEAEKYLRAAATRASDRYTTPKDGEPLYYLGLALKAQGKTDDAFPQFSKATWSSAWKAPAYFEMAQIASLRGDYETALTYANNSLKANADSIETLALQAALCRLTGHNDQAATAIAAARRIDPLDVGALVQNAALQSADQTVGKMAQQAVLKHTQQFPTTGLEAVVDAMNAGLWNDAAAVLTSMRDKAPGAMPLVDYYSGYVAQKLNQPAKATEFYQAAAKAPVDYAFPFQMEMIPVLEAAMAANPRDSRAPYYLGNLIYDTQPTRAVELWQKSADLGADFPTVYRNLSLAYTKQGQTDLRDKALAWLEKAAAAGGNAMVFAELDKLYEENGVDPAKRLALLESHQAVLIRDEIIAREANLSIFAGKADQAMNLIKSRFFRAWEGGGRMSLGDTWVNVNLVTGHQQMAAKKYKEALAAYQAALQAPVTLQEAGGNNNAARQTEVNYYIGTAYEALGDLDKARQAWTLAAGTAAAEPAAPAAAGAPVAPAAPGARGGRGGGGGGGARGGRGGGAGAGGARGGPAARGPGGPAAPAAADAGPVVPAGQFGGRASTGGTASGSAVAGSAAYYQGLALQKLGQADRAKTLFQQLLDTGTQALASRPVPANTATVPAGARSAAADAFCLSALGNLGLGNKDQARQQLTNALKISPDHLAAKLALANLAQ